MQNLVIAGMFIAAGRLGPVGTLPLPLGVAGHEGSTVLVGLNGLRLLRETAWRRAASSVREVIKTKVQIWYDPDGINSPIWTGEQP